MDNENDQYVEETTAPETEPETTPDEDGAEPEKPKKPELTDEQRRGILQRELTKLNKKLGITTEDAPKAPQIAPSNEPDYAKLAYLETKGIQHPDDQKIVQDEAHRLKLPLTDVLAMEHIKSRLRDAADQRAAQDGMPKGRGRSSGPTKNDVDYWLAKGETPDDQELAEKVIDARIKQEQRGNKFADDLYTG